MKNLPVVTILFLLGILSLSQSCRRDIFYTEGDAKLGFSEDTVHFDTVFTTVGSITLPLKLFNNYKDPLLVSTIALAGGDASQFRMNVDGDPGTVFHDIEIPANDSLYIFIEVTVDPNNDALPFVIEDSILFETNGNLQDVKLIALGQNANFHYGQVVCDTTWTDDLPHVIIGSVLVDTLCTLTIEKGCDIYMHGGSYFYVLGTLEVEGDSGNVVTFQGDRLEDFYKNVPGQWEGIYFLRGSFGNNIRYAEIKNSNEGIALGFSTNPNLDYYYDFEPELDISNTKIYDCQNNGILSLNSKITATNVLIYNIGLSNVALFLGGEYNFRYCTIANYSSEYLTHQTPSLGILDYFAFSPDLILQHELTQADFTDCIIYGSLIEGNEVVIDSLEETVPVFNFNFINSIVRTDIPQDLLNHTNCIFNNDPQFTSVNERNYIPGEGSPAVDAGIDIGINEDLRGMFRPIGAAPDIGAYETQ